MRYGDSFVNVLEDTGFALVIIIGVLAGCVNYAVSHLIGGVCRLTKISTGLKAGSSR